MQRANSLEKILMLAKTEGKEVEGSTGWDGQKHHRLNAMNLSKLLERV